MRSFGETPGKREALLNKLVKLQETPVKREETPEKGEEPIYAREYMLWLDELTGPEVWPPYLSKPPLLMDNLEILEEARQAYERVKNSPDMYEFAILLSCQYQIGRAHV